MIIWHNNRCATSRAGLELLQSKGLEPEVYEYIKEPPTKDELKALLKKLNLTPDQLVRSKDPLYKKLFGKDKPSASQLINTMVKNPTLIERPVLLVGNKAVVGRPIENFESLL